MHKKHENYLTTKIAAYLRIDNIPVFFIIYHGFQCLVNKHYSDQPYIFEQITK